MAICPHCGQEYDETVCEVLGCHNPAQYEGWYRVKDFAGMPTGLIQIRMVCSEHVSMLIGKELEQEK